MVVIEVVVPGRPDVNELIAVLNEIHAPELERREQAGDGIVRERGLRLKVPGDYAIDRETC